MPLLQSAELRGLDALQTGGLQGAIDTAVERVRDHRTAKATDDFLGQIEDPGEKAKAQSLIDEHGLSGGAQKYIEEVNQRNETAVATYDALGQRTAGVASGYSGNQSEDFEPDETESSPYTPTPDPTPASDTAFHDNLADDLAADMGYGDQYATTERVVQDFDTGPEFSTENSPATGAGTMVVPPRGDERGEGASGIVAVTDQPTPSQPRPAGGLPRGYGRL